MFRVSCMDENYDFSGFEEVWARVTELSEEDAPQVSAEILPAEAMRMQKRCDKSRAVRFIPET